MWEVSFSINNYINILSIYFLKQFILLAQILLSNSINHQNNSFMVATTNLNDRSFFSFLSFIKYASCPNLSYRQIFIFLIFYYRVNIIATNNTSIFKYKNLLIKPKELTKSIVLFLTTCSIFYNLVFLSQRLWIWIIIWLRYAKSYPFIYGNLNLFINF
jgi:hypothetical protein